MGEHTVKTVAETPDPHVKVEPEIPQEPFDDFNVKPDPAKISWIAQKFFEAYLRQLQCM